MDKKVSFEKALEKLEQIVAELEDGNLPLDQSLKLFEEGINLSQFCTRKLSEAEKKVEKLIKTASGEFLTEPLDTEGEENQEG